MKSILKTVYKTRNRTTILLNLMYVFILFFNISCVNKINDDDELPPESLKPNSNLTITTRTGTADAVISYPVHLYAFNTATSKCVEKKTLNDSDAKILFKLPAGRYTILAFAGATEDKYNLPSAEAATPETVVSLKTGATHADLMTDRQNVTLEENESNQITIVLKRKVMMLGSAVVNNLPQGLTSVSLSLEPLFEGIRLSGEYTTAASGQHTVELTKGDDGTTWSIPAESYLLPGNTVATIKITTVNGNKEKMSYSFSSNESMEANYKLNITGRYTAESGIVLNGTVSGDRWAGSKDINFSFDDDGNSKEDAGGDTPDEGDTPGKIPAVGNTYKGCYVLSVDKASGSKATVTLVAPKKWKNTSKDDARTTAAACSLTGISGTWRLPTEVEARLLCVSSTFAKINDVFAAAEVSKLAPDESCFYNMDNGVRAFTPGTVFSSDAFLSTATVLALISITIEQA